MFILEKRKMKSFSHRILCATLSLSLCISSIGVSSANASPLSTNDFLQHSQGVSVKDKVGNFFDRSDVISTLQRYGVSPLEAKTRIDSLTDREASQMAALIDEMPAGGDGVGAVIGAIVLVFIVLLFTDIIGLTKVFPFTRSVR